MYIETIEVTARGMNPPRAAPVNTRHSGLAAHVKHPSHGGNEMALKAIDLKPKIGAELKVDAQGLLHDSHRQEIRELLVERGVIIARDML